MEPAALLARDCWRTFSCITCWARNRRTGTAWEVRRRGSDYRLRLVHFGSRLTTEGTEEHRGRTTRFLLFSPLCSSVPSVVSDYCHRNYLWWRGAPSYCGSIQVKAETHYRR